MCPYCYHEIPDAVAQMFEKMNLKEQKEKTLKQALGSAFGQGGSGQESIFNKFTYFDTNAKQLEHAKMEAIQKFKGCQCYQKSRKIKPSKPYSLNPEAFTTSIGQDFEK